MQQTTRLRLIVAAAGLLALPGVNPHGFAQTILGRISGSVKDASGAVVPGARITVTNDDTGLSWNATTDHAGNYVVTNLPVGTYDVSAEAQGFKKSANTGYELNADGRITADFVLQVGSLTEKIEVTAVPGETVNTVSGEVGRVIDSEQMDDLALNGRNYMQLVSVIPGVALLDEDQMTMTTTLTLSNQSVNGNRAQSNYVTIDGGSNLDPGNHGRQFINVGVDFIEEVKVQTSNFSAEYGRNSGASINVVTKHGGNQYHGSLFEMIRNDKFDARNFFSPQKTALHFNDFGWSFGGPIKRQKLFFFAGEEWKRIRRDLSPSRTTLPTRAERRGDFSDRSTVIRLPGQTTPVPNKDVSSLITPDGRAIANVYNAMEKLAASYVDTPTANNAIFQPSNPFNFRNDLIGIDYRINDKHSLYGRYNQQAYAITDPFGTYAASPLPVLFNTSTTPATNYQLAHTWTASSHIVNEAKVYAIMSWQRTPPSGDYWQRSDYGFTFPTVFNGSARYEQGIPTVTIAGYSAFVGPSRSIHSNTTDINVIDNLTVIRGAHTFKAGMYIIRDRRDADEQSYYNPLIAFNTAGNTRTTGFAMTDALLGNFLTYDESRGEPIAFFRYSQYEAYVMDNWKVHPRLNVELGLRYEYGVPTYAQANNMTYFDPRLYDPAHAVTVTPAGNVVSGSGNPFNGLIRVGSGVPPGEMGRLQNVNLAELALIPAGGLRGIYGPLNSPAPRFSFAWSPLSDNRTSVRGGFGMFFDRPQGSGTYDGMLLPPWSDSTEYQNGNLSNPSGGSISQAPLATVSMFSIPWLKWSYIMNWSFGVQRELPHGLFVDLTYAGNEGRRLLRMPDINQPSFSDLIANAALPAAAQSVTNALRPFKGYAAMRVRLSDSNSNYNALQAYITKRKGNLILTGSYTWSHALGDSSTVSDNPENWWNRKFNYGPATYDRRHILVVTYTYRLPWFHTWKGLPGGALKGWELSGITRAQSGAYATVTGNTSIGSRRADYVGGTVALPAGQRTVNHWFNTAAFKPAPNTRYGNSGVGDVQGPGLYAWDVSLRKEFRVTERIRMRFQGDAFNAFNRANFRGLVVDSSNLAFGTIGAAGPPRNIQCGLRMTF